MPENAFLLKNMKIAKRLPLAVCPQTPMLFDGDNEVIDSKVGIFVNICDTQE